MSEFPDEFPNAIDYNGRICFSIMWFATEKEADAAHKKVRKRGDYYNGGWLDGMACGRDKGYDKHDEAGKVNAFAVTTR